MIIGRSEVLIIVGKWKDEKTRIRCQASFTKHAFSIEGIIDRVSEFELRLVNEHSTTTKGPLMQLVVRLTDDLIYGYADSREVTGDAAKFYPSCLTIGFPPIPEVSDPDTIAFAEISPNRPF